MSEQEVAARLLADLQINLDILLFIGAAIFAGLMLIGLANMSGQMRLIVYRLSACQHTVGATGPAPKNINFTPNPQIKAKLAQQGKRKNKPKPVL